MRELTSLGDRIGRVTVVNTCAVTSESERKSKSTVRRVRRQDKDAFVAVIGCSSQLHAEEYLQNADFVCGTRNKRDAVKAALCHFEGREYERVCIKDPSLLPYEEMEAPQTERTRAYVKIEDGCNRKCAYCIIAKARGKAVSDSEDAIISRLIAIREAGYREAVLTGIETSYYGTDTKSSLVSLLQRADELGFDRLRLGSMDPSYFTDERIASLAHIRHLAPHFHLSLQSGSSSVLARMRRPYTADTVYNVVEKLRRAIPGIRFSLDVIVGFPGETEEEFLETVRLLEFIRPVHAHIFPYSKREGTEAAKMPGQISGCVKRERAARLDILQNELEKRHAKEMQGKTVQILFEAREGEYVTGHAPDFTFYRVKTEKDISGSIADVKTVGFADGVYEGEI